MLKKNLLIIISSILILGAIIGGIFGILDAQKNTVSFDLNGGIMEKNDIRLKHGASYELPSPTKSGFVFGGWYYNGEYVESIGESWKYNEDLTLVAEWILRDDNSFVYEQTENGYVIVDYRGVAKEEIIIPSEYNSVKIVSIKDGALSKLAEIISSSENKKIRLFVQYGISYNAQNLGILGDNVEIINYTYIGEDGYYYADKGEYLSAVCYVGSYEKDITVPIENNGKPIKEIGDGLFYGAGAKVTQGSFSYPRILIPNTVTKIGKNSFAECNGIKVSLYHYNDKGDFREVIDLATLFEWSENLELGEGNVGLVDVISQIRPAFGWTAYSAAKLYIKLDANGGVVPNNLEGVTVTIKKQFSLPTPTREGYNFDGWYYGEELVPQSGETWSYVKHVKLIAKWSEK